MSAFISMPAAVILVALLLVPAGGAAVDEGSLYRVYLHSGKVAESRTVPTTAFGRVVWTDARTGRTVQRSASEVDWPRTERGIGSRTARPTGGFSTPEGSPAPEASSDWMREQGLERYRPAFQGQGSGPVRAGPGRQAPGTASTEDGEARRPPAGKPRLVLRPATGGLTVGTRIPITTETEAAAATSIRLGGSD